MIFQSILQPKVIQTFTWNERPFQNFWNIPWSNDICKEFAGFTRAISIFEIQFLLKMKNT